MSLLLKALQNAAKNREAGAAGEDPAAATAAPVTSGENAATSELSLEPIESATRSAEGSSSRAEPTLKPRTETNTTPRGTERNAMANPNQTRAQNVFIAGAGGSTATDSGSPGIIEWLTRRPIVAFSTAAGIFAIGYGVYLYLQLTNPGIFVPRQAPVASAPPAPSPAPPPAPPAQAAPSVGAVPPSVSEAPPVAPPAASIASANVPAGNVPAPAEAVPAPGVKAAVEPASGVATTPDTARPGVTPPAPSAPASIVPAKPAPVAVTTTPREPAATPRVTAPANRAAAAPRGRPAPATASTTQVNSDLSAAYQALERGQLNDAERLYRQALATEPRNVDAMIGLGSTLTQQNRADAATQMYLRALEIDPRNSYAQAGLLSIGGRADPQAAEARLKQLIAREPSAYLYFTLGNLYAEQNQWAAAQGAYFQAFNMAPDNPDYAFNLAIGLEHLSQPRLALDYYRRAVSIAQSRGNAQFALPPVQTRIRSLEAALGERP